MLSRLRPRLSYANVVSTIALFAVLGGGAYAHHRNSVGPKQLQKDAVKKRHVDRNAIATRELRPRSVRPASIGPNAVRRRHILDDAIRPRHILDGAVTEEKLADGVAVSGPPGPQGEQGPPGPSTGPAGGDLTGNYPDPEIASGAVSTSKLAEQSVTASRLGPIVVRSSPERIVSDGEVSSTQVSCAAGETLISGGGSIANLIGGLAGDLDVAIIRSQRIHILGLRPEWRVAVLNRSGSDQPFRAQAVCLAE
jgi:hypothetical protein